MQIAISNIADKFKLKYKRRMPTVPKCKGLVTLCAGIFRPLPLGG